MVYSADGIYQVSSRRLLFAIPHCLGLQISSADPESGRLQLFDLRKVLPQLAQNIPGVKIETIGFDQDHLHMVVIVPPRFSIAAVIGRMKSQSSAILRGNFEFLNKVYWKENIVWSPGYFVSSVGADEKVIKRYVEYQGRQDSGQLRMKL